MTQLQTTLQKKFPDLKWQFDKALADLTYFRIGGPAEVFWEALEVSELQKVVAFCTTNQIKLTMLGGASNVLVADQGITGLVIHLKANTITRLTTDEQNLTHLSVAAGCKTSLLVGQTVQMGLTGLEYFLGVPGTVGGAIFNNSHYLSHLLSVHLISVEVLSREGKLKQVSATAAEFAYDSSRFQKTREIIVAGEFALAAGTLAASQALIKEATEYRACTQPLGQPSSGCIFQNTPNTPDLQARFPQFADKAFMSGGFLIDQTGLKGLRQGEIEVSHKHAAFFVNNGHGTSQDVLDLITQVKDRVRQQFGVELHEEVFFLN